MNAYSVKRMYLYKPQYAQLTTLFTAVLAIRCRFNSRQSFSLGDATCLTRSLLLGAGGSSGPRGLQRGFGCGNSARCHVEKLFLLEIIDVVEERGESDEPVLVDIDRQEHRG